LRLFESTYRFLLAKALKWAVHPLDGLFSASFNQATRAVQTFHEGKLHSCRRVIEKPNLAVLAFRGKSKETFPKSFVVMKVAD